MTSTDGGGPAGAPDLALREADAKEADGVAALHYAARLAAVPSMPPPVHSLEETRGWMAGRVATTHEVWVAEDERGYAGYVALSRDGGWLDDLYVAPDRTGRGVGSVLLDLAKARRPDGFALWVFASNEGARRFYSRHGLHELEHTDGSTNEERTPDLRMAWPGRDPLAYLRGQLEEATDELALVVARRAALTAAVQRYKDVPGHAGRDPEREAELARRMVARAPGLPVEAWQRIVDVVITVSLDAQAAEPGSGQVRATK